MLKQMVEFKVGSSVTLRLVDAFGDRGNDSLVAPHVIASRNVSHVG